MLTEYEALWRWLQLVSGSPLFLDSQLVVIAKLLVSYGGTPAFNDTERNLIDKLAVALGLSASHMRRLTTTNRVWFEIADELQAGPKRTDSIALILNRIVWKLEAGGVSLPSNTTWDVTTNAPEWDVTTNAPVVDV